MSIFERDFIQRMIRQLAEFIGRLLRLKEEMKLDQALDELRRAGGELLGVDWELISAVDAQTAVSMLGDPRKAEFLAHLLAEEADIRNLKGDASAARATALQALELWEEARGLAGDRQSADPGAEAAIARARALLGDGA